jgi:hypothetical protein
VAPTVPYIYVFRVRLVACPDRTKKQIPYGKNHEPGRWERATSAEGPIRHHATARLPPGAGPADVNGSGHSRLNARSGFTPARTSLSRSQQGPCPNHTRPRRQGPCGDCNLEFITTCNGATILFVSDLVNLAAISGSSGGPMPPLMAQKRQVPMKNTLNAKRPISATMDRSSRHRASGCPRGGTTPLISGTRDSWTAADPSKSRSHRQAKPNFALTQNIKICRLSQSLDFSWLSLPTSWVQSSARQVTRLPVSLAFRIVANNIIRLTQFWRRVNLFWMEARSGKSEAEWPKRVEFQTIP